jgi:hypothetical protein
VRVVVGVGMLCDHSSRHELLIISVDGAVFLVLLRLRFLWFLLLGAMEGGEAENRGDDIIGGQRRRKT